MKTRLLIAAAVLGLGAASALIGPASPAGAVVGQSAAVSETVCVDEDGELTATLVAGDAATTFVVLLDGVSTGEGLGTEVAAGETGSEVLGGLDDGEHTVEVLADNGGDEAETLVSETRAVACDVAPVGPYTNVLGSVSDSCEGAGYVTASNQPIGGNVEDLQDVAFRVLFTATDDQPLDGDEPVDSGEESGEDGEDPVLERAAVDEEVTLDEFVLGAGDPAYERAFSPTDLGSTGDLRLVAGDETIASAHIGLCVVVAVESGAGGGGPAVVNAGL